jgi:hypothetical protein
MEGYVSSFTDSILNKLSCEVNKKKTKEKIMNNIIDPLLKDLATRYYPYFIIIIVILGIIVLLLISILILHLCTFKTSQ